MKTFLLLHFSILSFVVAQAQQKPCDDKDQTFPADTTIVLKNGTTFTFNRCDFFDMRNCMDFYEIRTQQDLQEHGLTTQDNQGNVLLTCGMVVLQFKKVDGCDFKDCLDHEVKIRIPILMSPCLIQLSGGNKLYKRNKAKLWEMVPEASVIENETGKKYFEFYTKCPGSFNCDKRLGTFKVKFKARKFKEITSFNVTSNCPLLNLNFYSKRRGNIVYAKLPCINPDSLMINIVGINSAGETEKISKPLSQFISKFTDAGCRKISDKVKRKILGIFPLPERNIYRKYLIN